MVNFGTILILTAYNVVAENFSKRNTAIKIFKLYEKIYIVFFL